MRPIDANALYREVKTECNPYGKPTIGFDDGKKVLELIDAAPTIEPEVRHGRWIHVRTAGVISVWKCSECDNTITANFAITNPSNHDKFCYNCGAKMDGGSENGLN